MPFVYVSLFYAAYFAVPAVQMAFLTLYLQAEGFELVAIAYAMTLPWLLRPLVGPIVSFYVDRSGNPGKAMAKMAILGMVCIICAEYLLPDDKVLKVWGLSFLFWSASLPLGEAVALHLGKVHGFFYAHTRLWGSVSFICMTVISGVAVEVFGLEACVWLVLLAMGLCVVFALKLDQFAPEAPILSARPKLKDALGLLRMPAYLLVLVSGALAQASHGAYYSYGSVLWANAGYSLGLIGVLWALGVIAEVVLFRKLPGETWRAETLLVLAGIAGVARWGIMAFDPPAAVVTGLQLFHAFTFGAARLGAVHGIFRLSGNLQATAQSLYAVAQGFAMAFGIYLSGVYFAPIGPSVYALMAVFSVLSLLAALALFALNGGKPAANSAKG